MKSLPPLASHWIATPAGRVHWRAATIGDAAGARPPIVLVHGLGVSGTYLVPVARELATEYRVYVPDLPGFGKSDKPKCVMDVCKLAEALRNWMRARGVGRPILLGHSLGCQVIVELAFGFPELVDRLILVSPTFDPAAPSPYVQLLRLGLDGFREKPAMVALAAADYLRAGPLRVARTLHLGMADQISRKLPDICVPVLVVTGSRDPIATLVWAKQAANLAPQGKFAAIEGGPHAVNFSQPTELARFVRDFSAETCPTSSRTSP